MAGGLILQLLCSPVGNRNFLSETKQNFTTEWTPRSVYIIAGRSVMLEPMLEPRESSNFPMYLQKVSRTNNSLYFNET